MKIKVEAVIEIDPSDIERFTDLSDERIKEILNDKGNTFLSVVSSEKAVVLGESNDYTWTIVEE